MLYLMIFEIYVIKHFYFFMISFFVNSLLYLYSLLLYVNQVIIKECLIKSKDLIKLHKGIIYSTILIIFLKKLKIVNLIQFFILDEILE
jgi:hypothetical protein